MKAKKGGRAKSLQQRLTIPRQSRNVPIMSDTATQDPPGQMTLAEFLDWDDGTRTRYQLLDGRPVAMAPPSAPHGALVAALIGQLSPRLTPGCRLVAEAGIVRSGNENSYYQADLALTCQPVLGQIYLREPRLIIEVLSQATRQNDLGPKLEEYRDIASVETIVHVHADKRRISTIRRQGAGWFVLDYLGGMAPILDDPALALDVTALFAGLEDRS